MYFCKRGLDLANRGPFLQDFEGGPPATGRWAGGPVRHCVYCRKDKFKETETIQIITGLDSSVTAANE